MYYMFNKDKFYTEETTFAKKKDLKISNDQMQLFVHMPAI